MSARPEKNTSPYVSIILPTYNQANYLPKALNSIFNQTWKDFELIVVNDGSTDNTRQVLDEYQKQYSFEVIHQENKKLPVALNTGFTQARGEYLTWTSSDNVMLPNMLEVLVNALNKNPEVGFVYADWEVISDSDQIIGHVHTLDYDRHLLMRTNFINACFMYRRICQETVGLYDPEYIHAEDWEYWWRIAQHFDMKRVPIVLYQYRLHGASLTETDVRTQEKGQSIGYRKLAQQFHANAADWAISKVKWELVSLRSGTPPGEINTTFGGI